MTLPDFSAEQWEFLAVLKALGGPVSIDLIGELAPLTPGPLFDLFKKGKKTGVLRKVGEDRFIYNAEMEPGIDDELKRLSNPEWMNALIERMESKNLLDKLDVELRVSLLNGSGRTMDAAQLEYSQAMAAIEAGRPVEGTRLLEQVLKKLQLAAGDENPGPLYASAALKLARLYFRTGTKMDRVRPLLERAGEIADMTGDRRLRAMIGLNFGMFYYATDRLTDALEYLSNEMEEIQKLGDEDILERSAEFFGLYYYLKGMYREAADYFARSTRPVQTAGDYFFNWPVPAYYGYCAAVLGQFHRAVGLIDANRRRAEQRPEAGLAVHFKSLLGLVLLMMDKRREAADCLNEAVMEAEKQDRVLALALAQFGLAYLELKEGRVKNAHKIVSDCLARLSEAGILLQQYPSPFLLELMFEFHRRDLPPLDRFDFEQEMKRVLQGENIHLKGAALRIRALASIEAGEEDIEIMNDLTLSRELLVKSGDPLELARTLVETARHKLKMYDHETARELALSAWEGLSGRLASAFPDDLRFLLDKSEPSPSSISAMNESLDLLFESLTEIIPSPNLEQLLLRQVETLNRFFKAERGCIFWFEKEKRAAPVLRAGRNLSVEETVGDDFKSNMTMVLQAHRENRPVIRKPDYSATGRSGGGKTAIICLPFLIKGRRQGILFHENSYLKDGFDHVDESMMARISRFIGSYVERVHEYAGYREERNIMLRERKFAHEEAGAKSIVTGNLVMEEMLAATDRAAASESTVLITGETGVGKELLAHRIHGLSPRSAGPFIVLDLAGAPSGLVESELFGHEKGAFTGADQQKPGRLELADRGTLFIDELGEIPLSVQVKLLRALQEKKFMRLGGARIISSDFRLVAATNRSLEKEVDEGRFRKDLYYRVNVVPIHIPPLRDRGEDVIILARRFARHFEKKFNKTGAGLTLRAEARLKEYTWPGNVRELKNVIERAVLLTDGPITDLDLPRTHSVVEDKPFADNPSLDEIQRRYIRHVLNQTGGRISGPGGAAEVMGIKRTSLYARMKKLKMR